MWRGALKWLAGGVSCDVIPLRPRHAMNEYRPVVIGFRVEDPPPPMACTTDAPVTGIRA
jgi:hypothetical protein